MTHDLLYNRRAATHETPHAPATIVWSARAAYWAVVVLRCPFCHGKHYHGGGDGPEPALGSRVAHCAHDGSYVLAETAASIAERTPLPHGCPGRRRRGIGRYIPDA